MPIERALNVAHLERYDFITPYVEDLRHVVDLDVVRGAKLSIGADPLGGSNLDYWEPIAARYGLNLQVVNKTVDPTFRFMRVDHDGKIRMDCSSPYAMQRLIGLRTSFDVAWACDTDHDRHGIVARSSGLLNPNHYLAVAAAYLFEHRPQWPSTAGVGKTVVSSSLIDRVTRMLQRPLLEVPVGFKWFVDGLLDGTLGFAGEESAGASCLRRDGSVWTTDKDGIVLGLLAAEMTARTGRDPGELYRDLTAKLGDPVYERIDAPATAEQKTALAKVTREQVSVAELGGEPILAVLSAAPGNGAPIGGLKVIAANGWFAARPSGTEDVYKLYAESFLGREHLRRIQGEAREILAATLLGSRG
jgi:phosphoglucomutase